MATVPVQLDEESLIREQIAQIDLPEGVRFKSLVPSSEWTGEPAWRIYFNVSTKIPFTKKRIAELGTMKINLRHRIFDLQLGKWPFIHFKDAK